MFIRVLFLIVSLLSVQFACYGEPISGSDILRNQELIKQDQELREKAIETKVYIKKIVVTGATLLSQDEIKEITSLFEKKWLTKFDIQTMEDLIKQAYSKKGVPPEQIQLSFEVKKGVLTISFIRDKTP